MNTRSRVEEKTLSDGSKVYNVILLQGNQLITLNCYTEKQAEEVEKFLYLNTDTMLSE